MEPGSTVGRVSVLSFLAGNKGGWGSRFMGPGSTVEGASAMVSIMSILPGAVIEITETLLGGARFAFSSSPE